MAYSYDLTTPAGQVRLLISDVSPSNGESDPKDYVFEDAEIVAFLSLVSNDVWEGAALAAETWARVCAHLSAQIKDTTGAMLKRYSLTELAALAQTIREAAKKQTLQTGSIDVGDPNDLLDSYRPIWRGIADPPIVE